MIKSDATWNTAMVLSVGLVTRDWAYWQPLVQDLTKQLCHVGWIHPQQILVGVEEQHPELLLLDARDADLPVMETCRLIRAHPGWNLMDLVVVGAALDEHSVLYEMGCSLVLSQQQMPWETLGRMLGKFLRLRVREDELSRLQEETERQTEAIQQQRKHYAVFSGMLSHEVRTPLGVMEGFVTNLLDGLDGDLLESQRQSLEIIHRNIQRLKQYLGDILDHSKLEVQASSQTQRTTQTPPRRVFQRKLLAVPELVDEVIELYQEHYRRKHLRLVTQYAPHLPRIWMDRSKIRQVLVNLLSNAHKFTPSGGMVSVHVDCLDEQKNVLEHFPTLSSTTGRRKAFLQMSVQDTGVGIAQEDISGLFGQFVRIESTELQAEGSGLGLAICKQLVEEHGGEIQVESGLGRGTTFRVMIPVDLRRRRLGKLFLFANPSLLMEWLTGYQDNLEGIETLSTPREVNDMLADGCLDVLLPQIPEIVNRLHSIGKKDK